MLDFVEHGKFAVSVSVLQGELIEWLQNAPYTGPIVVPVQGIAACSPLNHFELINIYFRVRVPHRAGIFIFCKRAY